MWVRPCWLVLASLLAVVDGVDVFPGSPHSGAGCGLVASAGERCPRSVDDVGDELEAIRLFQYTFLVRIPVCSENGQV